MAMIMQWCFPGLFCSFDHEHEPFSYCLEKKKRLPQNLYQCLYFCTVTAVLQSVPWQNTMALNTHAWNPSLSQTHTHLNTLSTSLLLSQTHMYTDMHTPTHRYGPFAHIFSLLCQAVLADSSLFECAACVQNRCMCAYMYVLYKTHLCACLSGFSSSVCFRKFSCSIWIMERWFGEWNQSNWQLSLWWFDLLSTENQLGGSGAWGAWQIRSPCHRSVISSFNQHSGTANTLFISQTLALALERGFRQV